MLAVSRAGVSADFAPALQWVATTGGSGNNSVTAVAADARGNLYITGATTSLDFPVTSATQAAAGGSTLVRINLATASASKLFPANLPPVNFVAAAAANPGTLFSASGNQIWKSADAGSTWTMVSQFAAGVSVAGLAVDPTSSSIVYAGTTTAGIYKSVDGALTWTAINNGIPPQSNGSIIVGRIWIEPAAPHVILASSGLGLVRSTDGGNTWTVVAVGNAYSTVAFDAVTAGALYFANGNNISRSTDSGQTFVFLPALPNNAALFTLATDPHQAGLLYAGSSAGIYQSSDGGGSWSLRVAGSTTVIGADPNSAALYANASGYGVVKSTDGFATTTPVGPNGPSVMQLIFSGGNLFEISAPSTDMFVLKLDGNGNVVYSTYFGGSGSDAATAVAVGSDGSVYITGTTNSKDLPVTAGAYLSQGGSFVFKLNPDGAFGWATYFTAGSVATIAVDSTGSAYIGGSTAGGLPTTPGAYQTTFQQTVGSNGFFSVVGPLSAFVTKFNATGTGLAFSTYIPFDNQKNTVSGATALAVDAAGDAWIGVPLNSGISPGSGTSPSVVELNSTGSAVLGSAVQAGLGSVTALAIDPSSNVYVAGSYSPQAVSFPATAGAFQRAPQPVVPTLQYQAVSGGGSDAFVAKWDSSLTHLLAATLLGGELPDTATSVAVDATGTVIVGGYTDSKAFPTHAPFQESFSSRSGFVAAFDSNLSNLLFSTYLGDGRPFAAYGAFPDGSGNILMAGSTLSAGGTFIGGDSGASFSVGSLVIANKIALGPAPTPRLDSVQNYASHLAAALAPGEPITALGAGFGNGAQIVLDGFALQTISATATSIVAVMPSLGFTVHTLQISNNGTLSNAVVAPAAAASPAIYSVDGSGAGQGYILNSDGTLNSPSNPAAMGSAITIFVAGAGQYSESNGYAVAALMPSVYIDGFYCNGIAAVAGPVMGLPGTVYQLSVFVPDPATLVNINPDLKNFKFPAQSSIQLVMGPTNSLNFANSVMASQSGIFLNIK